MIQKKILYICSEAASGMIPFAANIIHAATKSRYLDVFIIAVDNKLSYKPYFEDIPEENISILKMPDNKIENLFNRIYSYNLLKETKRICKKNRIDNIHLLTGDYTCSSIISQLKNLCTVYYTVHDLQPHEKKIHRLKDRIFEFYMRRGALHILKKTDNLVTNSKNQYSLLEDKFPDKSIYYHPFPSLITNSIMKGKEVCPELDNINDYILFFGTLLKYKGTEYLYDAFKKSRNIARRKLVIAGSGDIYFKHDNDPDIVIINRYINDNEVQSLFKNASCVVYPYISATQSGVLSLAYYFQTPVIASDIPFFKESADDDCCIFFKCADSDDLANKLDYLFSKADISKIKNAQKNYYDNYYSEKALTSYFGFIY
jgi:glycosyltransferase involved in cell wall biosynthesis